MVKDNTSMEKTQPTPEQLRASGVILRYLVWDSLPLSGLKRMTYYTSLPDRDGVYYMLSYRQPHRPDSLQRMIDTGQIVPFPEGTKLEYPNDLFLSSEGDIYALNSHAPWETKERISLMNIKKP